MSASYASQRGQTLPVWTFGLLTIMMLMFMLLNYAEVIKWQIRAQNAADSVAQATLSVQATNFNEMLITLNSAATEEWRMRRTLDALMLVVQGSGGCSSAWTSAHVGSVYGAPGTCINIYNNLRANYLADLNRYGNDVTLMASINRMTKAAQISDMTSVFSQLTSTCGAASADCGLGYTLITPSSRPITNLQGVINMSGYNQQGFPSAITPAINPDLLPLRLEVIACANIQPLWANFFHMTAPTYMAIGRAAATTAQVTQEWLDPGEQINPATGTLFQPPEYPDAGTGAALTTLPSYVSASCPGGGNLDPTNANKTTNCWDWYGVDYGAQNYTATLGANPNFNAIAKYDEFSPSLGWWSALPLAPYSGTLSTGTLSCKTNK